MKSWRAFPLWCTGLSPDMPRDMGPSRSVERGLRTGSRLQSGRKMAQGSAAVACKFANSPTSGTTETVTAAELVDCPPAPCASLPREEKSGRWGRPQVRNTGVAAQGSLGDRMGKGDATLGTRDLVKP